MNINIQAMQLLGLAIAICGTWVLQIAWRAKERSWPLIMVGWSLIFGSFYLWSFTSGADKGVALGVTAWILVTLLFLFAAALKSPLRTVRLNKKKETTKQGIRTNNITRRGVFQNILTAIIIGPLAGLAAMAIATLLLLIMRMLQVEYTANLAIASIMFPLLWGVLAVMLGYQRQSFTRLVTVLSISASCFLCLWAAS